ncbi:MAG: hypothetical protein R2784_18780 [Saprospiraceae bacterium]
MKRLDYINSPRVLGQKIELDLLFDNFIFEIELKRINVKPKNKIARNRIRQEKLSIQESLFEQMRFQNKRMFKGDVALHIVIQINQINAPSIHNIPKHYIDILCEPDSSFKRKYGILKMIID